MSRRPIQNVEPTCVECGKMGQLTNGREVYPDRSDLWDLPIYRCPCGAFVGCHKGTDIPKGYPAGPHTRRARRQAEEAFKPMVQRKINRDKVKRSDAEMAGYTWLAGQLEIGLAECHFAMMNAATCQRVVRLCMGEGRR